MSRVILLKGSYKPKHVAALEARGCTVVQEHLLPSFETIEQEQADKIQDALNLFVITPQQTGFSSVAELTAQAIASPETTGLLIDKDEELTPEEAVDAKVLGGRIHGTGAKVFDDINDASDYVQVLKD